MNVIYFLIQQPNIQKQLTNYASKVLSQELNTKIYLDYVDFELFNTFILHNLDVYDRNEEILTQLDRFEVRINPIGLINGEIWIKHVGLYNGNINLHRKADSLSFNYQFILDNLFQKKEGAKSQPIKMRNGSIHIRNSSILYSDSLKGRVLYNQISNLLIKINLLNTSQKVMHIDNIITNHAEIAYSKQKGQIFISNADLQKDLTIATDWDISVNNIELHNSKISYNHHEKPHRKRNLFDIDHFTFSDLTCFIQDLNFKQDSILFNLKDFRTHAKSGFNIYKLTSDVSISNTATRLKNTKLISSYSHINSHIKFSYRSLLDIFDFSKKVQLNIELDKCIVDNRELALFTNLMSPNINQYTISGLVKGKINNLKGKSLTISTAQSTFFMGDIRIKGFPDVNKSFIDLSVKRFATTSDDLHQIYPSYHPSKYIQNLGLIQFKGRFTGFLNDFVAYGNINTNIGDIRSDLNMKIINGMYSYIGNLSTHAFQLNKFLNNDNYGLLTIESRIDGKGLSLKDAHVAMTSKLKKFTYNGYTYSNVDIDGSIENRLFEGSLTITDPNADLNFAGTLNLKKDSTRLAFHSDIKNLNMQALNLSNQLIRIKGELDFNFSGHELDNLTGEGTIINSKLNLNKASISLDTLYTSITRDRQSSQINILSDVLDLKLEGAYKFSQIWEQVINSINHYYTVDTAVSDKKQSHPSSIDMYINVKKPNLLTQLISTDIEFKKPFILHGTYSSKNHLFAFRTNLEQMRFNKFTVDSVFISFNTSQDTFFFNYFMKDIYARNFLILKNSTLQGKAADNKSFFSFNGTLDSSSNYFHLFSKLEYDSNQHELNILQSELKLNNQNWEIREQNSIAYRDGNIYIQNFGLKQGRQSITILNNTISKDSIENLNIRAEHFELSNFNPLIFRTNRAFEGVINGDINMSALSEELNIEANLSVANLLYGKDSIGDLIIHTLKENDKIKINASLQKNGRKINISGHYLTNSDVLDRFHIRLNTKRLPVAPIEEYFGDFIKGTKGLVSADVLLTGNLDNPKLDGEIHIQRTNSTIKYLNTEYYIKSATMVLANKKITLVPTQVSDISGNIARIKGDIEYKNISRYQYNFSVSSDNFLFMNTRLTHNDRYYGTLYAQTLTPIEISGDQSMTQFTINAKTNKHSAIHIPLADDHNIANHDFIQFIDKEQEIPKKKINPSYNYKGILLNMNLTVTPDVEAEIIFDQQAGDIIKGRGNGYLSMSINPQGDFKMSGDYTIEKGNYLFTLNSPIEGIQLVNKKFNIKNGSKLVWTGDPYKANIDVDAVYRLRASKLDNQDRITTDVILQLSGLLTQPDVNFDITTEGNNNDNVFDPTLELIKRNPSELNKQVFGLLVMNRFLPNDFQSSIFSSSGNTSVSELLSKELSHLVSKVSGDIDFNFNLYRYEGETDIQNPDEVNASQQEIQLGVSKRFFDNRLSIDIGGNIGLSNNQSNTNNAGENLNAQNNITGDFNIEYYLNPDGNLRVNAFRRNQYDFFIEQNQYKNGIGLSYKNEFDNLRELWANIRRRNKNKDD